MYHTLSLFYCAFSPRSRSHSHSILIHSYSKGGIYEVYALRFCRFRAALRAFLNISLDI